MKKPILLLVDDDRAVLEALEAELTPVFSEICRVESFEDPRDVLDVMPRWREEERLVAGAVVDQRMPHLTGVELLRELRAGAHDDGDSHPVQHLQAVLLTGYADLDAAIAAKNEAGVTAYLEKPWPSDALRRAVGGAFGRFLAAGFGDHLVFRELRKKDEVREFLRLQYDVYRETWQFFQPEHAAGIRVDAYEVVSRFFGLFLQRQSEGTLIGTLRVAGSERSPVLACLHEIVAPWADLARALEAERPFPLPMLTYLEDREPIERLYRQVTTRGERVVEPGRLTVHPAHRASAEVKGASHLIESTVGFFFFFLGIENAVLDCIPPHTRFYRPWGFALIPGTAPGYVPAAGSDLAVLHGCISGVPPEAKRKAQSLAARIRRTGEACRCAAFPECLPGPYEMGDFRGVDLFCPARAREVVAETSDNSQ